jgi:hypothetical protein
MHRAMFVTIAMHFPAQFFADDFVAFVYNVENFFYHSPRSGVLAERRWYI